MVIFVFNIMQQDKCATSDIVKLRPFIPSEEKCKIFNVADARSVT